MSANCRLRRLRGRLVADDGIALVFALAALLVLGMAGTSVVWYATTNQTSTRRDESQQTAIALAEAGLNMAYSRLDASGSPSLPSAEPSEGAPATPVQLAGGTASYYGSLDTTANVWTLTGIGVVPASGLTGSITKLVHGRVEVGSQETSPTNFAIWNYLYSDAPGDCMQLSNSVSVDVPLYVRGSLCLSNSASIVNPQPTASNPNPNPNNVQIGGTLTLSNSAHVGDPSSPLGAVHVAGGCTRGGIHACNTGDNVYGTTVDSSTQGLTKPTVDLAGWYANAMPGPRHPCTLGSFPGGFDNDTTLNESLGRVTITTPEPYDCKVLDAQGNLVGEIGWTGGSSGTLTVNGTIFLDGYVSLTNSTHVVYQGKGTIYVAGTFSLANSSTFCGVASCDDAWKTDQNLVAIVAGSADGEDTSVSFANNTTFQGGIYAVNDYREANSVVDYGPVIARQLYLANSTRNFYVPIGTPLPGMPSDGTPTTTLVQEPGSWGLG